MGKSGLANKGLLRKRAFVEKAGFNRENAVYEKGVFCMIAGDVPHVDDVVVFGRALMSDVSRIAR